MMSPSNWYRIGFDDACNAGAEPNPPTHASKASQDHYMRGWDDRRALNEAPVIGAVELVPNAAEPDPEVTVYCDACAVYVRVDGPGARLFSVRACDAGGEPVKGLRDYAAGLRKEAERKLAKAALIERAAAVLEKGR